VASFFVAERRGLGESFKAAAFAEKLLEKQLTKQAPGAIKLSK
jgi:hypothetical protein